MNGNLNNTSEHSYLCLVAIYAIHLAVFHLYSPTNLFTKNVTLPPQLQPTARWKPGQTGSPGSRNSSSAFLGAPPDAPGNDTFEPDGNLPNGIAAGVEPSTFEKFPHQVSLRRSRTGVHFCGGTIVDEEWIVTVAHCVYNNNRLVNASRIKMYTGDLSVNESSYTRDDGNEVSKIMEVRENFEIYSLRNDIGFLKLRSKLTLNDEAVAAKTLRNETVADVNQCQLSDRGVSQYENTTLDVDILIVNRTLCQKLIADFSNIPQEIICPGNIEGAFESCQGDSASGVICDDVLLTGVVSWGEECGLDNFVKIYKNIDVLKNWLLEAIATSSSSQTAARNFLTPGGWGVLLGCLVFLFTYTDGERFDSEAKE